MANGGSKVKAVLFILKEGITESEAKSMLWRRETRKVGSRKSYTEPDLPNPNSLLARTLTNFEGVDVVIYTDFPEAGKLLSPTAAQLAELAVASAKNTQIERGLDGISYLIAAKEAGIATPLMADYEQEILKLTQTDSLEAALAKVTGAQPGDKDTLERLIGGKAGPQTRARLALPSAPTLTLPRMSQPKQKVGRNDRCPCGSGKKYKKCCMRR